MKRLLKAPQYFLDWKESSARYGAAHVLALAKTYDPSFDAARVAQGKPSKKTDGTELTSSEYAATWKGMRGYATELVDGVDLGPFWGSIIQMGRDSRDYPLRLPAWLLLMRRTPLQVCPAPLPPSPQLTSLQASPRLLLLPSLVSPRCLLPTSQKLGRSE